METITVSEAVARGGTDHKSGLCLLVVEDDDADAYLIVRALSGHPAVGRVVHASDGVEALRMVEAGEVRPDLAFIDLQMPRKNGFSLLTALADKSNSRFPMIVLTSSASPVDAQRSRLRSALRVITKPESVDLLEATLASAIDAACPRAAESRPLGQEPVARFSPGLRFDGVDRWGVGQPADFLRPS